jgi:hypothetical protein
MITGRVDGVGEARRDAVDSLEDPVQVGTGR